MGINEVGGKKTADLLIAISNFHSKQYSNENTKIWK